MAPTVRAAPIQAQADLSTEEALAKHLAMVDGAAEKGAEIACLQEIFFGPHFFKPGNLGYPVFDTRVGEIGVFICSDRRFPEPVRALGRKGAQITFNPSATVGRLSRSLWEVEKPAKEPTATAVAEVMTRAPR